MRNTSNISFYARESKTNKQGLCHLEMSVNINGERKFLNLPLMVKPSDFNKKRQSKELVEYMDLMRARVNTIMVELLKHNEPLTTDTLLKYIRNGGYKSRTLSDVCNEFLSIQRKRIGTNLSYAAFHKYEVVTAKMLKEIGDVEFSTLNYSHISTLKISFEN